MGTADRIERERLEKRTRILDAARELFLERGVEAVTLREVADRIEYSTTAIYVHFETKAALVEAMVTEDFAAFSSGLENAARIVDPVERLATLHDAYIDFAMAMPRHYQLLFLTPVKRDVQHPLPAPTGIEGYRVLLGAIDEAMRAGRLREDLTDPHAVAQIMWAGVHGLVSLLIVHGEHTAFHWRSKGALSEIAKSIAMRGILRDPDAMPTRSTPKPTGKATGKAKGKPTGKGTGKGR
jgi:AcrR family transcriptional regulator